MAMGTITEAVALSPRKVAEAKQRANTAINTFLNFDPADAPWESVDTQRGTVRVWQLDDNTSLQAEGLMGRSSEVEHAQRIAVVTPDGTSVLTQRVDPQGQTYLKYEMSASTDGIAQDILPESDVAAEIVGDKGTERRSTTYGFENPVDAFDRRLREVTRR